MIKLSVCIPTYNRSDELYNCLNSIYIAHKKFEKFKFDICVSDNGSNYNPFKIIQLFRKKFNKKINIKFHRFSSNKGVCKNFLKVISMSKSEFIWAIGDDDLLLPNTFKKINKIFLIDNKIDFFFINSFNLDLEYLKNYKKPFDTKHLPKNMKKFSHKEGSRVLNFFELIDPNISNDFLMGIYLSIFRRNKWEKNLKVLNKKMIKEKKWISNFDNSCFNIKVFGEAFKNSRAYFQSEPLSVNLSGGRVWKNKYYFLEIVRFPEMLDYYRSRGLGFFRYIYCKNFALRNFSNYMIKIFLNKNKNYGWEYISFYKHFLRNLIFPNVYLSIIYFFFRKFKNTINHLK